MIHAAILLFAAFAQSAGYEEYQKANSLFTAARFAESSAALDRALSLDPNLVPALTLKAKLAMSINRFDVANESLRHALEVDPKASYAQFLLGFSFYQQNEMPQAIEALEKARKLNARDPRTLLYLGLARETTGNTEQALSLYKDAIRLEESVGTLLPCARLLMVMGDLDGSASLIERALKREPNSRDAHFERGRLYLKKSLVPEAAKELELALSLHSGDITDRQIHTLLVQAYRANGQDAEAAKHAAAVRESEKK
jgi:tetratricopeptide (TPR) repeat protein